MANHEQRSRPSAGNLHTPKQSRRRKGRGQAPATIALVRAAYAIAEQSRPITVRGIAYKLFTQGHIQSMARNAVNKVSRHITKAREDGTIPWEWIVDENRVAERVTAWSNSGEIIQAAVNGYRRNYWLDQPEWLEVWSEKGTVRGVLRPILDRYGVTFRVMHGYTSATVIQAVAEETRRADRNLSILYVGDFDPSGLHMSLVDIPGRLRRYGAAGFAIHRLALTTEDVGNQSALPSFDLDTKKLDPRHGWFTSQYGNRGWELDAMDPRTLRERIEQRIRQSIEWTAWQRAIEIERREVESMQQFHQAWTESISGQDAKYLDGGPSCG